MEEIKLLQRRLARERQARKQAEAILEQKAIELYHANQELTKLNAVLEQKATNKAEELRKTQEEYEQLVETAHDIIYRIDNQGIITYMNSVVHKILGIESKAIIGKYYWELVPEEHRGEIIRFYLNAIAQQQEQTYFEFPTLHKNGKKVWFGQNVRLIFNNNQLQGGTVVARNITKLRKFQKELRRSEERYRSIIENMELGLMEVGLDGLIIKPYPRFCKMVGYEAEELIGKDAAETFLPPAFIPIIKKQDNDRKKGIAGVYEIQLKKKDGDIIWVLISGAPILDLDGSVISTMGVHYNITPQKNLQKALEEAKKLAEEAQEAEQQFLANMSHEIRTPLNAIIGMAHLLYDTNPTVEQKEYLSVLKTSSDLLHRLISDVLDLSKIGAGKLEPQRNHFDLKGLVLSLIKNFQIKLEGKPITFTANFGEGLDHLLIGDDLFLNQILLNLLGNAAKFTQQGSISVEVALIGEKDNYNTFEFRVVDSGIGIPKEKQALIFQSFRQVDGAIKRKFGGTGLGLTITKQLIDLQNGHISVESTEGQGATFIFQLTYECSDQKAALPVVSPPSSKTQHQETKHILVVEDNYMNRKYIASLLKKWKLSFKIAHNGKEGVEMALKEKFDLILMDIQMPIMDGYEATIAIRNQKNFNQYTEIVALTASAMLSKKAMAFDVGMNDYISKPFKPQTLFNKLQRFNKPLIDKEIPNTKSKFKFHQELDREYLAEVYEDDFEYAYEMFHIFLTVSVPEFKGLLVPIQAEDWAETKRLSHKLKPAFAMVGLTESHKKVEYLEQLAQAGDHAQKIRQQYELLQKDLDKFLPILKEQVAALELCQ